MSADLAIIPQLPLQIGDTLGNGSRFAGISPDFSDEFLIVAAQDAPKPMSWVDGLKYAAGLKVHKHHDWRLPTPAELDVLYKNRYAIDNFSMTAAPYNDEYHSKMNYWALLNPELVSSWKKQFNALAAPSKETNSLVDAWLKANGCSWGFQSEEGKPMIYGAPSQSFSSGAKDPDYCMINRFSIRCVRTVKKNKFTF